MFLAFGGFIIACGGTHVMEVLTLWEPLFWTAADVKIVTAVASVGTAIALPPLVPRVLALLDAAKLSETRRVAVMESNERLEQRIAERTADLEAALAREQDLRARAEAANRSRDEFLGLVSHELRTPLNAILGWSSILLNPDIPHAVREKGLAGIARSARAQAQVVDDLLDTSRVIAGKLRIAHEPVAVIAVIDEALETIQPSAQVKGVAIKYENQVPGAVVVGDAQRIQQIVWNLLTNAVKFTSRSGTIRVSLVESGPQLKITVEDSGIGIDPGFLPHVFDRFSQADSSPTRSQSGLGLGLALVRHLVELHGGCVSVASDGVGRGATFTVSLPLMEIRDAAARPDTELKPPDLRGIRVLVVDDDPETLDMLVTGLAAFGAGVLTAFSGREAREKVLLDAPDVLVSDLAMPDEDGFALLRELRKQGINVPAIAFTAHVRPEHRARVRAAGFSGYVTKPATALEVARAIAAAQV